MLWQNEGYWKSVVATPGGILVHMSVDISVVLILFLIPNFLIIYFQMDKLSYWWVDAIANFDPQVTSNYQLASPMGKYEAVHPKSSWVSSLDGLCKQNEGNLQRKRGRKKVYLLNYSFASYKTFRFVLSMHKSIRKTLLDLHNQELWGCSASHLPNYVWRSRSRL